MATPTSNVPNPQSYEQILSDMLSSYAAAIGVNDFNVASVNTSFFEVVALTVARASGDLFQILRDFSVDRATGDALQNLAIEYGVTPAIAQAASGLVNILDTSFTKISTKIYAGTPAPNIGTTVINVSDASTFPASGSVYLGRGTPDIEGPIPYAVAPVQTGSFWTITLSTATTKYHNLGETVILAQGGNRVVAANVLVISPGVGTSPDIQYSLVNQAVILDGETEVDNIQVTALIPGAAGNVPADSIVAFASAPFSGASVINPLPFTTGVDPATDAQLRVQIKNALASQGLGTATAIESALIGATTTESSGIVDSIVSDSLMNNTDGSVTVYIDNGSGYEATSNGVGLESIVDSALGGEQFFQLQTGGTQAPVAKAFLQSTLSEPFDLIGGDTLAVVVGGVTYQHVFANSDFASPGGATAYEVTASINADTTLGFEATTAGNGEFVVIDGIAETDNTIFVTVPNTNGRDASVLLGFPSSTIETLRLYKNNVPLTEDGSTGSVFTQAQQLWSNTIANGDTLILSVDGTAAITYTILNSDFIATGLYTSVNNDNSLASWIQVFNNKLTGVTATIVGEQIELTSNLGANNRANVTINSSSTLVSKGMFSSTIGLTSQGQASEFTLDRNTAQFELVTPLVAGDKLSAGSSQTAAFVTSTEFSVNSITLTAPGHIWILVDKAGQIIPTGVIDNTVLAVTLPSTNIIRYTSNVPSAFSNVLPGDYVVIWSAELPTTDRLEGRVHAVTSTTLDVLVTPAEWAAALSNGGITFSDGFVVLRSDYAPQRFEVPTGTSSLDQIAAELQTQTDELVFSVFLEEFLVVTTNTMDTSGSVLIVTSDTQGKFLQFSDGQADQSSTSLLAFYDSQETTGDFPLFIHSTFTSPEIANPPDSFITNLSTAVVLDPTEPNNLICMLNPYGGIDDAQDYGENPQISSLAGTAVTIVPDSYMHRVRTVDRFYVGSPLEFGFGDSLVAVVDENVTSESYTIPMYRDALTNNTYTSNSTMFNAYDADAGATASFTTYFSGFDFSNFKVYMQAKKVLKPTPAQTAILYRAAQWGSSGENISIGYIYPSGPNQSIGSTQVVGSNAVIEINLASGVAVVTSIAANTQWNITVTANTPSAGIDQVTFTYNGTGTAPNLTGLSGGEYVNISTQTGFNVANTGIWRVSTQSGFTPTATAFSIQMPHGLAVPQSNVSTLVAGAITFYEPSPTTAAEVAAYVNNNISQFVTATLVNDGGSSGAGVIVLSTYEDSGFTFSTVTLQDGVNWLLSSNVSGSPQFTLKIPLTLSTDVGYTFNNGEKLRFVPTTIEQVSRFISILAVTGLTSVGTVELVDRGTSLELATQTLGSSGAIQIIGGSANSISLPVLDSATNINNNLTAVSVNNIASELVTSDQWFRLQAAQTQKKVTGFDMNTDVTVLGNNPTTGESTIVISNSNLTQRNFGKPRNNIRTEGDTFRVEKQGSLVCISWTGVGTNPMFESTLNFNDSAGGTANVTLIPVSDDAQYTIATGNVNFTALSIGDFITISGGGFAANNQGTFLVTGVSSDGTVIQVTNTNATAQSGVAFTAGVFSATTGVSEGDSVIFSAPFSPLNQGIYRVIREYNNSIWIQNPNVVEEEVNLPLNSISLGFDSTTEFAITKVNNLLHLEWTGTGTAPTLGNANQGDIITLGTDFASGNQGSFMVVDSSNNLSQITQLILPSGSAFALSGAGTYFTIYSGGNAQKYYVWFNVNGTNTDPAPVGYTSGIEVSILSGDTATSVASKTALALTISAFSVSSSGNVITVTTVGQEETNPTINNTVPAPFEALTSQSGVRTYLEAINPLTVPQGSVFVTGGVLQDNRPQMQFWEYEASIPGDLFVVSGNVLTLANAGSYPIVQVLNSTSAIVKGNMASVLNVNLDNNTNSVYVEEGVAYSGYKHVYSVSAQPGAPTRNLIIFDTIAQSNKIDESASVELTSLAKLNFNTTLRNGLDAYRYNTGLIAEANRIVYGDPRDPVTYPGVGAAGADIFIKAPLTLSVEVAVDIRLLTGAPFSIISQQVRSNIAYLINSNPVGQSIDISSIVSIVRSIPGISSVAISSPQYSPTEDLIKVTPSEKARILNPATDISVNQIGT